MELLQIKESRFPPICKQLFDCKTTTLCYIVEAGRLTGSKRLITMRSGVQITKPVLH